MTDTATVDFLIKQSRFREALDVLDSMREVEADVFWVRKTSGMLHRELGQLELAREDLADAQRLNPGDPETLLFLGAVEYELGDYANAEKTLKRVLSAQPGNYHAIRYLALLALSGDDGKGALQWTGQLQRRWPQDPESNMLHGQALASAGRPSESLTFFDRVTASHPDRYEGYYGKAQSLRSMGETTASLALYAKACEYAGATMEPCLELARFHWSLGNVGRSEAVYRDIIEKFPRQTTPRIELARLLVRLFRHEEALELLKKCAEIEPHLPDAFIALGDTYKTLGIIDKYLEYYDRAMELQPPTPQTYSAYLLNSNYLPQLDRQAFLDMHRKWESFSAAPRETFDHSSHDRDPDRRLRIGYLSADFKIHAVYYFIEPILANHDKSSFEIFCYYNDTRKDSVTERFIGYADHWRDVEGLSDERLGELIYNDGIDILVDLSGHTAGGRLEVLLQKPAPVQVEYEAYPNTTGLSTIDYKLTDRYLDTEEDQAFHTERLHSIGDCFICYQPHEDAPSPTEPPCTGTDTVTFGSFCNLYKINDRVIDLWSRLLDRVPDSRLMLFRLSINELSKSWFEEKFAAHGADLGRIDFIGSIPERYSNFPAGTAHMGLMSECDFILDTFPYNNHTIACEALWLGVPILTLYGDRHASRVCSTILHAIGHPELVASTEDDYLEKAVELANDRDRIVELRRTLRDDFANSRLMDFPRFTRDLEKAYRSIWKEYAG
ncbi:MAG TPA: tetratricopeptide repeat protein [Gammaproteobacteria bacterium]|nr:tetratricopeptide repeat protein [Gammaproteobacteria bacterium]